MPQWSRVLRRAVPQGGASEHYFRDLRAAIVRDLAAGANDRSLAGGVDPLVAPLVALINSPACAQYVTSSSCSGRVALFHRAQPAPEASAAAPAATPKRKRGALGRGTLFQSHDPLASPAETAAATVWPAVAAFAEWRAALGPAAAAPGTELLQLKFEPLILHVLCESLEAAAALLQCASESGQMKSGVISCSRGAGPHRKITCCITSPLCFDVPLYTDLGWAPPLPPPGSAGAEAAWCDALTYHLRYANALFEENRRRHDRFTAEFRARIIGTTSP